MALELLSSNPPPHKYWHDLESLHYAIIYVAAHYDNGEQISDAPYEGWNTAGLDQQLKEKSQLMIILASLTPGYSPFRLQWIEPMLD